MERQGKTDKWGHYGPQKKSICGKAGGESEAWVEMASEKRKSFWIFDEKKWRMKTEIATTGQETDRDNVWGQWTMHWRRTCYKTVIGKANDWDNACGRWLMHCGNTSYKMVKRHRDIGDIGQSTVGLFF